MKRQILSLDLFGDRLNTSPPSFGDGGEHERLLRALKKVAMGELTERQRECLRLMYAEGKGVCEIADTLGVKPSTVSKHLKKARLRLRRVLGYSFPRLEGSEKPCSPRKDGSPANFR